MKKPTKPKAPKPSNVANAVTTSAMSLTLLASMQATVQAQDGRRQPAAAQQNQFSDDDAYDKYFGMGYNYCDAKLLADYWGGSPGEAKLRLGQKMLAWGPDDGDIHIREARSIAIKKKKSPIWYTDGGYDYDDAERLAKYWGTGIGESKTTMTRLLIVGEDKVIRRALKSAIKGE